MSQSEIQKFTDQASPENWLKYAQELRWGAVAMWLDKGKILEFNSATGERRERPSISRSFLLNCGLSIENLLKAYLIAIDPSHINNGRLGKSISTHDLIHLASKVDIDFSKEESELMKVLSEAIPYWGRYPIPRYYNQIKKESIADEDIFNTFKALFVKIFDATFKKIENGWDAGNGVSFPSIKFRNVENDGWEMST